MFRDFYETGHQPSFSRPNNQLESLGYLSLDSKHIYDKCDLEKAQTVQSFSRHWENLGNDPYIMDGGNYRKRNYGVFFYSPKTQDSLTYLGNQAFFQDKGINRLNGGIQREFQQLTTEFASSTVLRKLILFDIEQLPIRYQNKALKINIHQIRIIATSQQNGSPTPEGIHQDGHDYGAQHFINRHKIQGGESRIYNLDKKQIFSTTLINSLDTIIVKDPLVFHGVSPIKTSFDYGFRDMLLIDINQIDYSS